jgi:hypothetical protein
LILIRVIVTIYHNDSSGDICPDNPADQVVVSIAQCYNSSWIWYSIDECIIPGSSPSDIPSTDSSSGASVSKVGPIVGGVVGGVVVVVIAVVALFMFMRRKKRQNGIHVADGNPRHEMPAYETMELPANPQMETFSELTGSRPHSVKKAPVELPADYYSHIPPKQVAQSETEIL